MKAGSAYLLANRVMSIIILDIARACSTHVIHSLNSLASRYTMQQCINIHNKHNYVLQTYNNILNVNKIKHCVN